ncbi:MAG: hydroxymethylbilane synthase [Actinobacteria bacterium]|nr:hydroxymethylbilane synthase [Actinomycetota bacterium]
MRVTVATRGSALALWQANHVAGLLRGLHEHLEVELVVIETVGDRVVDRPISSMGGQGIFIKEVQAAVIDGRADVAVHSAKDLPSDPALNPPELLIAAVPERADPRDVLVGRTLDALPTGATIATGSARRRVQLADLRNDLSFADLRGNIDTRLARASQFGAVVMAKAALDRLGYEDRAAQVLSPSEMLPQVGQGALALECRAGDDGADVVVRSLLTQLEHGPSREAVDAERAFLGMLGGGCDLPVGAYAEMRDDGALWLRAMLASGDGRMVLRDEAVARGDQSPTDLGHTLARHLLDEGGGRLLLEDLGLGDRS